MSGSRDLIKSSNNKEQLVDKKNINKSQLIDGTKSSVKSKPIEENEELISVKDYSHRIVLEKTEVKNSDTSDKGFKTDKTDVKGSVKGEKSKLQKTIHKNNLKNIRKKVSEQVNAQRSKTVSEQVNVQNDEGKATEEQYSAPVRSETYVQQTVSSQYNKAFSADSGYADSLIQRSSDKLVKSSATSDILNAASVLSAGIKTDKKDKGKKAHNKQKRRINNSAQVEQKKNVPAESSIEQRSECKTQYKSDCQTEDKTEHTNIFEYRENAAYSDIKTDHSVKIDIKSEHKHSVNELNIKDSLSANVTDNIKGGTSRKTKQSAYKKNIRNQQKADFIKQSTKQRDIGYKNEADIRDTVNVEKRDYRTFTYKSENPIEYKDEKNSVQLNSAQPVQNKSSERSFEIKPDDKTRDTDVNSNADKGSSNTSIPDNGNKELLQNKTDKTNSDTLNTRNKKHISSAEAAKIADNLGIKTSFSEKVKSSFAKEAKILKSGLVGVSSFAVKSGVKAGHNVIKENISVSAEETPEAVGIDIAVKAADTAKTTSDVYKGTKQTARNIKELPKKTSEAVQKGIEKVKNIQRKYQKMRQMQKAGQKTAKIIGEIVLNAAKGTATSVLAALIPILCLIILIVAVFGFVLSCMWDTSSDLDTTKIIKWVSELDYNRQNYWYGKGKTGIEIEKNNDGNGKAISYHYLCAVDVPQDFIGTSDTPITTNCVIKMKEDSEGQLKKPSYSTSVFTEDFSSKDDMLENFRWTTDDYLAALAFLQVKNNNLGWIESVFGFVGEAQLKQSWQWLHNQTFDKPMVVEYTDKNGNVKYTYPAEYETSYSTDNSKTTYYFFRKYSVNYLIENDIVKFDENDETKNKAMKEQYRNIYKYGNIGLVNLGSPVELADDETIEDRIIKHFGKQLVIDYEPPEDTDSENPQWGKIVKSTGYHYAIDISADYGEKIYSPINGLCKVTGREGRNLEYTISTSYNGTDFDFTKAGYVIKISCVRGSYIPLHTPVVVTKGQLIGAADQNNPVNRIIPDMDNDTENEDIFADMLFPCCTATDYSSIGSDEFEVPPPLTDHIHMEMYQLPCDFTDKNSIKENVLDPELFFDHSGER